MSDASDWNQRIIEEFRANQGRVGGPFQGAPIVLLHHRGRRTGVAHVSPVMYMAAEDGGDLIYVFASKSGAPTSPEWYYNLVSAGTGDVEVGAEAYPVTVTEVTGPERDGVYAEHAKRFPAFADYAAKTVGVRTIPVLALRRA